MIFGLSNTLQSKKVEIVCFEICMLLILQVQILFFYLEVVPRKIIFKVLEMTRIKTVCLNKSHSLQSLA